MWSSFFVNLRSQTAALCTWHFQVTVAFSKEKSVQQFGTWISFEIKASILFSVGGEKIIPKILRTKPLY